MAEKLSMSMLEEQLNDDEPPSIKLGDASVAAPFTSKLANVIAIPNIIRQGRCTLVATIQMYKILALNCLISAYSLSVLYLDGIKFGDGQVTISGMLMSVCFLSISRAKVSSSVTFSQAIAMTNREHSPLSSFPKNAHRITSGTGTLFLLCWVNSLSTSPR
jgi:magnesium-transporting ATPase (P-type)